MRDALLGLLEPTVTGLGYELVELELGQSGHRPLVRVFIDRHDGEPVGLDDCERVSHAVEAVLDAEDPIQGAYQLEVSSPGLDRVLAREKDFEAAVSREIRVQTRRPLDGRKRYRGRLVAFEAGVLKMNVDGDLASIPFDEVEKANTIYEFTSADFAKESRLRGSSQSGGM